MKLNQPYGPLAKTLLEKQAYPDPSLTTYDDSAWTMGMANNIEVKTIEDKAILDAPAALLKEDVVTLGLLMDAEGSIGASGASYVVKHNGALNLITLRYRLKDSAIKGAKTAFKVGDEEYPAGSFIIPASDRARREIEALGLVGHGAAVGAAGGHSGRGPAAHRDVHHLGQHREGGLGAAGLRPLRGSLRPDPQGPRAGGRQPRARSTTSS